MSCGIEDHRGDRDRAGERAAPDLVDAGDEPRARRQARPLARKSGAGAASRLASGPWRSRARSKASTSRSRSMNFSAPLSARFSPRSTVALAALPTAPAVQIARHPAEADRLRDAQLRALALHGSATRSKSLASLIFHRVRLEASISEVSASPP